MVGLALAAVISPAHPGHRLAAVAFVAAGAGVVWGPLLGRGAGSVRGICGAAAGMVLVLLPTAIFFGGGVGAALSAGVVLAGFLVFMAGISAVAGRMLRSPGAGVGVAGLVGGLFLASFHLGDPFLEWGGSGSHSAVALASLHWVNPMSAAVGNGLDLDWLRMPLMYSGFEGGVSGGLSAAQFYRWDYVPWWAGALTHGGAGVALLATTSFAFRGTGVRPKIEP